MTFSDPYLFCNSSNTFPDSDEESLSVIRTICSPSFKFEQICSNCPFTNCILSTIFSPCNSPESIFS